MILQRPRRRSLRSVIRTFADVDNLALLYVAVPNILFLAGWIVSPWGWSGAIAITACVAWTIKRTEAASRIDLSGRRWCSIVFVASAWCIVGGIGHFVYANIDWTVRDAVLVDLVREPWPVRYQPNGENLLLRSAIGFYLPAALIGKLTTIRVADLALLASSIVGVAITFALLLRDRPSWSAGFVRLLVFVMFSGMDIIPEKMRHAAVHFGSFIEWWAKYISFQSQSTSLFWAPNHTLPVWIATAWLASQAFRTISIERAALFVLLLPLSSPIAALGVALYVGGVVVHRMADGRLAAAVRPLLGPGTVVTTVVCLTLVYPYLVAGSDEIRSGFFWDMPWIGEQFVPRYIEFVLVEFLLVATVLLLHEPRDPLLWLATLGLLALPIYQFGPFNDLAMRGSISGLEVLAIRLGTWMGSWTERRSSIKPHAGLRVAAAMLFLVGAVTPFLEISRPFVLPRWPMDTNRSIIEASSGAAHYVTPDRGRWLEQFIKPPHD